jgi:hypothetical protein
MFKDIVQIFPTPVYNFTFPMHNELKQEAVKYLNDDEIYAGSPVNYIKLTDGKLHKHELFRAYYHFFTDCFDLVMEDLGYSQKQAITTMWGTKQVPGNYHQPHKHANAFLAGVYYLHGNDSNGTTFYNTDNFTMIMPDRKPNAVPIITPMVNLPFEEGVLRIFPAWIVHGVHINTSAYDRFILGVNSMPVGKAEDDRYDRYFYPDMTQYNL